MTVDLVGSTAYKSAPLDEAKANDDPRPEWVNRFRQFYQQFPDILETHFRETEIGREKIEEIEQYRPKIWKTIGDEILFCCRIFDLKHLSCCVSSFLKTLDSYGRILDTDRVPLDVKGAGWTAAFPAENISIEIFGGEDRDVAATEKNEDYLTEQFEAEADAEPHKYDFLGKGIDAGFRVARNATADRFTASLELGYLLAEAAQIPMFMGRFSYHGRETLKGVNGGKPYPVISIDTERDQLKRLVRTRERILTQEPEVTPLALRDFLHAYMENDGIDLPAIPMPDRPAPKFPRSYEIFKNAWNSNVTETEKRDDSLMASEEAANQTGSLTVPDQVFSDLEKLYLNIVSGKDTD